MRLFKAKARPDSEGYYPAAAAAAVQPGTMTPADINGVPVLLARWEEQVLAFTAVCPHAAANLGRGHISRWKVTCPDHDYCFDIRNGRILYPEDESLRLKTYPVKEVDGTVFVKVS